MLAFIVMCRVEVGKVSEWRWNGVHVCFCSCACAEVVGEGWGSEVWRGNGSMRHFGEGGEGEVRLFVWREVEGDWRGAWGEREGRKGGEKGRGHKLWRVVVPNGLLG